MKKYQQLAARRAWNDFELDGSTYSLAHLNVHEVSYHGKDESYDFVVTYGLHCFAKDDDPSTIGVTRSDDHETRKVSLERYEASKKLRSIIEGFDTLNFGKTTAEKFFCFQMENSLTGIRENYKVCFVVFKEKRLLRIHVTTAFFDRDGDATTEKKLSIYKIAKDLKKKEKIPNIPKEATRGGGK